MIHINRNKIHGEIESFEDIEPKLKSRRPQAPCLVQIISLS